MDEFHTIKVADNNRYQKRVNQRFPELNAARREFLGDQSVLAPKKVQTEEIIHFADTV